MSEWRPIETAPKGKVLIFCEDGKTHVASYNGSDNNKIWTSDSEYFNVKKYPTHWMPLPQPPQQTEDIANKIAKIPELLHALAEIACMEHSQTCNTSHYKERCCCHVGMAEKLLNSI